MVTSRSILEADMHTWVQQVTAAGCALAVNFRPLFVEKGNGTIVLIRGEL